MWLFQIGFFSPSNAQHRFFFLAHFVYEIHPCVVHTKQQFMSSQWNIVCYFITIPQFIYPLNCWVEYLGSFQFVAIMNSAAINILTYVFC